MTLGRTDRRPLTGNVILMGGRFDDRGAGGGQIRPQQHPLEHAEYLHQPVQR